ncbi:hypothetical protein ACFL3I_09675 [Pseudomonadota bacterium]
MAITETYLTNPEWFPGTGEGTHAGNNDLFIDFVGGPYHVKGLNERQVEQLGNHFDGVCSTSPKSTGEMVNIDVYEVPSSHFHLPDPPPMYREFDLDPRQSEFRVAGENMYALIDLSGNISGHLWTVKEEQCFHSNTFENFFRMLVTYRLQESGGCLLHSAGIVSRDEAYLFPGRSNDGKSTLSRLSLEEDRIVLSDDMNAITWLDGQPYVEKVPFTGDLKRSWTRSASYPLKALFAIRKSAKTSVEDLSPSKALTLLTACSPYLNADPHRMSQLLENHYQLTRKIPANILNFSLSGDIWEVIETSMSLR